jgi:hypothetical protein
MAPASNRQSSTAQKYLFYLCCLDVSTRLLKCRSEAKHIYTRYNAISYENFETQILPYFYGHEHTPSYIEEPLTYHRLSVLFMVMAIGSLMDTSKPAYNFDAEKYHVLAKAALFRYSLFDTPTINGIQALVRHSSLLVSGSSPYTSSPIHSVLNDFLPFLRGSSRHPIRGAMDHVRYRR